VTYPATPGVIPRFSAGIVQHYERMRASAVTRDNNHSLIHQVRRGNIRQLFPDELDFSITFQGSPIANFVDVVARDMAEGIAPLPALACTSGKMETDADQNRAERKNRIGTNFWKQSKLETQMMKAGADWYVTYGFLAFIIEPDTDRKIPRICVEDPRHAYYETDRYGQVSVYAKKWMRRVDDLCAMFPEYAHLIKRDPKMGVDLAGNQQLELIRWIDGTNITLLLPERQGLILGSYAHKMSRPPVVIAERPGDGDPRGQFDDVIWVQVARSIMATLALEAAAIAVQAPIAVPDDMDELPIGPHAIMQSKNSRDIHKVALELPPQVFAEGQNLDNELRVGSRYPEARSGGINASVVTGKGVEALLGTFDSQIKGAQIILKETLEDATAMCFEMDEVWWPNKVQVVSGTTAGSSFEFKYTPSVDIAGRYACSVTYGFAAGLRDPSQAIVTMLQLEGAGLIAKGTTMENLPFALNALQEQKRINVEASREALKQGFFALVQASGQLAAQGQDPAPIIKLSVSVIHDLENGKPIEVAITNAYAQLEAQQQAQAQQAQEEAQEQAGAAGGPGGGQDQFFGANGQPEAGVPGRQAPGQAGLPSGGRPTVEDMVAGFRGNGNLPVNSFTVRRSVATGT
jgi:hypothetical protein